MGATILGWVLIVIGVIAVLAGVAGGIAKMFQEIVRKAGAEQSFGFSILPTEYIEALTEFLNALGKAPPWIALIIIGFALIAWGGIIIG
jgi:hypothetical protein